MNHTPSTEERELRLALKPQVDDLHELLEMLKTSAQTGGLPDMHIENILKWYVDSMLEYRQATAKASEAAIVDKLRPLLVDDPEDCIETRKRCAELRQALNLDQEGEE